MSFLPWWVVWCVILSSMPPQASVIKNYRVRDRVRVEGIMVIAMVLGLGLAHEIATQSDGTRLLLLLLLHLKTSVLSTHLSYLPCTTII